ncbi:MAG: DUF2891 domain-containing protein [Holophaga sp.]|jgi:hypothetical protein
MHRGGGAGRNVAGRNKQGLGGGARPAEELEFSLATASRFACNTLEAVQREYPNKVDHILYGPQDVQPPSRLHPAFYGCFDWHSAVHGHWMLARLLRLFPDLPEAPAVRAVLDRHLAPARIQAEVDYLLDPAHRTFERTYGWAWLLKLAAELRTWESPSARAWAGGLEPLADAVAGQFLAYLPMLTYPNRSGTHSNTAFSLSLALDYARTAGQADLEERVSERASSYFAHDRDAPLAWEPGGEDFLSPSLEEAALMGKVLPHPAFRAWVAGFLPDLLGHAGLVPARVADRSDPKNVHLDGLNLSRARCLFALAEGLGHGDPRVGGLERAALVHARAALPFVVTGNYGGDHWLATYAVHLLESRRAA